MALNKLPASRPAEGAGGPALWNAVVETPRGYRTKYKYEPRPARFEVRKLLPEGSVFPFDFGFLPSTAGGDGDPLDVLVLMEEPTFPGVVVPTRLIGVIEADQIEKGVSRAERNDRLVAVATASHAYRDVRTLDDLPRVVVEQMERFFVSYNAAEGREFRPLGRGGPDRAEELAREGERRAGEAPPENGG
jgi:inorganic pyrophosphatase